MRAVTAVLLACCAACAPGESAVCQRRLDLETDAGTGWAWGVAGETLSVTLRSALSTCVSDPLRVDARLFDPDNAELPVTVAGAPTRTGLLSLATATFEFTPPRPGTYALQVAFEPSLGTRTVFVQAARDGAGTPFVRVPKPTACDRPWVLGDDAVLCEVFDAGLRLINADGGTTALAGQALVVAGDVAWSVSAGVLERRQFIDGGLVVTHSFPGFRQSPTPSVHTGALALRITEAERLEQVQLTDAGVTRTLLRPIGSARPGQLYLLDDGLIDVGDDPFVRAVEPEVVWFAGFLDARVSASRRPLGSGRVPLFELPALAQPRVIPFHGVERLPLWLDLDLGGGRSPLVEARDGAPVLTAWRREDVVLVGRDHVLVREADPSWWRVYRK